MVTRFPMICDSCQHKTPGQFTCTAFPDLIPLDPMTAEIHDEPRPDQDNDIVYTLDPRRRQERDDFIAFRHALGYYPDPAEGSTDSPDTPTPEDEDDRTEQADPGTEAPPDDTNTEAPEPPPPGLPASGPPPPSAPSDNGPAESSS